MTVSRRMEMAATPPTERIRQPITMAAAFVFGMALEGPCAMAGILMTSMTAFSNTISEISGLIYNELGDMHKKETQDNLKEIEQQLLDGIIPEESDEEDTGDE